VSSPEQSGVSLGNDKLHQSTQNKQSIPENGAVSEAVSRFSTAAAHKENINKLPIITNILKLDTLFSQSLVLRDFTVIARAGTAAPGGMFT
jgi:hypothetical protein